METLISMVIHDKKVDKCKIFAGEEDIKRILQDIKYNLDDIVIRLSHVVRFLVLDSETDSSDHQEEETFLNAMPLNTIRANFDLPMNNTHANASPC